MQNRLIPRPFARLGLIFLLFLTLLSGVFAPAEARRADKEPLRIDGITYTPGTRTLGVVAQDGARFRDNYTLVKYTGPDRAVIDIPDAVLGNGPRTISIQQDGIDHVELAPNRGLFYQLVRVTVVATRPNALDNLRMTPQGALLSLTLSPPQAPQPIVASPLPPRPPVTGTDTLVPGNATANVLTGIDAHEGTLTLRARPGDTLAVKNQFTLASPSRLVIDLAHTVLANRRLTEPAAYTTGPVRSIRLGQFDEDTVRIVVETSRPNGLLINSNSADRSQLALGWNATEAAPLPANRLTQAERNKRVTLEDINLLKRDGNSVIQLVTDGPMTRRVTRHGNRIELLLDNVNAEPAVLSFDRDQFPDLDQIRLIPPPGAQGATRLVITLDGPADFNHHLSLDGNTLDVTLAPKPFVGSGRMPEVITPNSTVLPVLPTVRRGTFTVVVDAGHGGKDMGANREGVYEKELNIAVATRLRQALEAKNITVFMTRTADTFVPLPEICAITNRIHPDAFVSVHTNASTNPSVTGLETYYLTPQSRDLAFRVHRRIRNAVSSPDRGVRTARYYVIHHTAVPAILCEMGYISNAGERASLQTEARQRATAEAIAQGVVEFLGQSLQAQLPAEDAGGAAPLRLPVIQTAQP